MSTETLYHVRMKDIYVNGPLLDRGLTPETLFAIRDRWEEQGFEHDTWIQDGIMGIDCHFTYDGIDTETGNDIVFMAVYPLIRKGDGTIDTDTRTETLMRALFYVSSRESDQDEEQA